MNDGIKDARNQSVPRNQLVFVKIQPFLDHFSGGFFMVCAGMGRLFFSVKDRHWNTVLRRADLRINYTALLAFSSKCLHLIKLDLNQPPAGRMKSAAFRASCAFPRFPPGSIFFEIRIICPF